jgi:hypothetical protein
MAIALLEIQFNLSIALGSIMIFLSAKKSTHNSPDRPSFAIRPNRLLTTSVEKLLL